jgi:hypothetical protein
MHDESGNVYEIIEDRGSFKLLDYNDGHSYMFKEAYEAIWAAIEIIRNLSLDSITDDHLLQIVKRAHVALTSSPRSVMSAIKREKMIRTYYDQIFLKILSQYRSGNETIMVSNKTNFFVDHEITSLIRKSLGVNLSIPDYKI